MTARIILPFGQFITLLLIADYYLKYNFQVNIKVPKIRTWINATKNWLWECLLYITQYRIYVIYIHTFNSGRSMWDFSHVGSRCFSEIQLYSYIFWKYYIQVSERRSTFKSSWWKIYYYDRTFSQITITVDPCTIIVSSACVLIYFSAIQIWNAV